MIASRFRSRPAPAPEWARDGDGESLSFTAVPARLWVFGAAIALVTLGAGVLVSMLAIRFAPESAREARILIVAAALCLCLPLVLLVKAPFRAHTTAVMLSHDADGLDLAVGAETHRIRFREITDLVWCTGTEYSRVVIKGPESRRSLLVGIARPLSGRRPDLPEMTATLRRRLENAGLSLSSSSRGETRYRRPSGS